MRFLAFLPIISLICTGYSNEEVQKKEEVTMQVPTATKKQYENFNYKEPEVKVTKKKKKELASYSLTGNKGFFLTAEFLYWHVRNNSALVGIEGKYNPSTTTVETAKIKRVGFDWEPGCRIGFGYKLPHDHWDFFVYWTYMHSKESKTLRSTDYSVGMFTENPPSFVYANYVKGSWKLTYNVWDLEIGKMYKVGKYFTLRPHIGPTAILLNQKFDKYMADTEAVPTLEEVNKTKFDYWGVGLRAGLKANWNFCEHFSLYGNLSTAIFGGEEESTTRSGRENYQVTDSIKDDHGKLIPHIQVTSGFAWGTELDKNTKFFGLQAGYEINYLFDTTGVFFMNAQDKNLELHGLTIKARFEF